MTSSEPPDKGAGIRASFAVCLGEQESLVDWAEAWAPDTASLPRALGQVASLCEPQFPEKSILSVKQREVCKWPVRWVLQKYCHLEVDSHQAVEPKPEPGFKSKIYTLDLHVFSDARVISLQYLLSICDGAYVMKQWDWT